MDEKCEENVNNSPHVFKRPNTPVNKKRRNKKKKNKSKKKNSQQNFNFPGNLFSNNKPPAPGFISWVESYTLAATWQLKHQVEYWKSKAAALEYENTTLHEIIKNNNLNPGPSGSAGNCLDTFSSNSDFEDDDDVITSEDEEQGKGSSKVSDKSEDQEQGEGCLKVSQEFIDFLVKNDKIKQENRLERERLKQKYEAETQVDPTPSEKPLPTISDYKELYGDDWEGVCTLETALKCRWIEETEKHNPTYWPVIPFNFQYNNH